MTPEEQPAGADYYASIEVQDVMMIESAELKDASRVLQSLVAEISTSFPEELQLFGLWVESPNTVCVVYRRTIDPDWIFGRRIVFPPHARPDDPISTGADLAEFLREPPGTSMDNARTDPTGVIWLGLGDKAVPHSPFR